MIPRSLDVHMARQKLSTYLLYFVFLAEWKQNHQPQNNAAAALELCNSIHISSDLADNSVVLSWQQLTSETLK